MIDRILIYLIIILLTLVSSNKIFGNIIYDKNDIFITEIELKGFKEIYLKQNNQIFSDKNLIKKIVLIKKTIKKLIIRNPDFVALLDKSIIEEIGEKEFKDKVKRDYFRFIKIRNEFIFEYYQNSFDISDLRNIFNLFTDMKLPISSNNCLTIIEIIDVKDNEQFLDSFFSNFKNNNNDYKYVLENKEYSVCINENDFKSIEAEIIKYIELITEKEFNQFIYAN